MKIAAFAPRSLGEVGSIFKFIFLASFVFFSLFFIFKSPAFAQIQNQPQPINSYAAPNTNPDVPNNLHTWTQNVMIEVSSALTCQLIGVDSTNPSGKCLGVDPKTNKIGFVENGGGAVRVMGNLTAMLLTPPFHSGDYFNYLAQNFGLTKHAYAETGFGFSSLQPIMSIWIAFRNIVYLLFVLVFIIIGIAIMLRVKIDPRTVMTIQNQIPRIIIGLLLVTFSFAIAGFLIDLMWIAIYLFFGIFSSIVIPGVADPLKGFTPQALQGQSPFSVLGGYSDLGVFGLASHIASSVSSVFANLLNINQDILRNVTPIGFFADLIGQFTGTNSIFDLMIDFISGTTATTIGAQVGGVSHTGISIVTVDASLEAFIATFIVVYGAVETLLRNIIPWGIPFFIILIAVVATLFRVWISLLLAYVNFLIDVVMAPFWIVAGILPGGEKIGVQAWLRDMLANLAVFPVTIAMFMLGKLFIDGFGATQTAVFVPPLIGNPGYPHAIGSLIGLGMILVTPEALKMTKAFFKAPKLDIAPIGKMLGVGSGTLTGATKTSLGSFYAYKRGALPVAGEKGQEGLMRRFLGKL